MEQPQAKKMKTEEDELPPVAKCDFKTVVSHVFHTSKDYRVIARIVQCTSPEGSVQETIQIGRFRKGFAGSKFLVSLNTAEVEWLIESIPSLVKQAQKVKDCDANTVLEVKEIDKRTLTVGVSRFVFPKGGSAKNLELTQSWIQNDDEVSRNIGLPLRLVVQMPTVLRQMLLLQKFAETEELRVEKSETLFDSFLTYVMREATKLVTADPSMNKLMDMDLMTRMNANEGLGAITYWIAAKHISMCFDYEYCPSLKAFLGLLKIDNFDYERLTPISILDAYTEKVRIIENAKEQELFAFVEFVVENVNDKV